MPPQRWIIATGLVFGSTVLLYLALRDRRRKDRQQLEEKRKMLRLLIEDQLCFGRPKVELHVITTLADWEEVEDRFLQDVDSAKIMGLDCEWINQNDYVGKVALLQLGLPTGLCLLIRTCKMEGIPESLAEVLKRFDVLKLGVAVADDGKKLMADFGLAVNGTVDLRILVKSLYPEYVSKTGLKALSEYFLGFSFQTRWYVCSRGWEDTTLSPNRIEYACNDAMVAVNIALVIALDWSSKNTLLHSKFNFQDLIDLARNLLAPFSFEKLETKTIPTKKVDQTKKLTKGKKETKREFPKYSVRKTPLYNNAYLEAPDGSPLCVCDIKKAKWYVEKDLGVVICEEPFKVRLRFEPAGRPVGQAGDYYLEPKRNLCVVCGAQESYLRKYVVPHEYRKFFPDVMRDHQSHDVLLTCTTCHQTSNMNDNILRQKLADLCDAPLGNDDNSIDTDAVELKALKSAGRALLKDQKLGKIPPDRKQKLTRIIKEHFKVEHLTDDIIKEASDYEIISFNANHAPHAQKVVSYFIENSGIIQLEKTWREHFLETMNPKFLPPHWSVDHQQERLDIRVAENRIDPEDYQKANGISS